jgi:hypothetical protein
MKRLFVLVLCLAGTTLWADPSANFQPGGVIVSGSGNWLQNMQDLNVPELTNTNLSLSASASVFVVPGISVGGTVSLNSSEYAYLSGGKVTKVESQGSSFLVSLDSYFQPLASVPQFVLAPGLFVAYGNQASFAFGVTTLDWQPSITAGIHVSGYYFLTDVIAPYVGANYSLTGHLPHGAVTATTVSGQPVLQFGISFWLTPASKSLIK